VIALARGDAVELPDAAAISVITLCGLHHGVLIADDEQRRPRTADSLIAATAAAHDLPVYTRDRDFLGLSRVEIVIA
jgi:predicted nucleic acid-binding protein